MAEDTKKPENANGGTVPTGGQAFAQKPKRDTVDPIVAQVEKDGLFGKAIPQVEEIQKKVCGEIRGPVAAPVLSGGINRILSETLIAGLDKQDGNMSETNVIAALNTLMKIGFPDQAGKYAYYYSSFSLDPKMLVDFLNKDLAITCPLMPGVVKGFLDRIDISNTGADVSALSLHARKIIAGLGVIKDPTAVEQIVAIYRDVALRNLKNTGNVDITKDIFDIKMRCVWSLIEIDTDESFAALAVFKDETDQKISAAIVGAITTKYGA